MVENMAQELGSGHCGGVGGGVAVLWLGTRWCWWVFSGFWVGEDSETAPFHILIPKMDYQRG